jgi:hypothetical protein
MTNNIKPAYWGHHFWYTMYAIATVYPERADTSMTDATQNYFQSLKYLLPCESCRKSYQKYTKENDTNIENKNNFSNRNSLIEFIFNIRNKVNKKLEIEYYLTLSYIKNKLNKSICIPGNKVSAILNSLHEAPYIPVRLEEKAFKYLSENSKYNIEETRKIIKLTKEFINNPDFNKHNSNFKVFIERNNNCIKIINKIYLSMENNDYSLIQSFSKDNDLHLKLLYLGCTIISASELEKLL